MADLKLQILQFQINNIDDNIISVEDVSKSSGAKFNPTYILLAVLVIAGLIGVFFFLKQNKTSTVPTTTSSSTSISATDAPAKSIALAEVATHKDAISCWLVIEGKVYDVTTFIPNHPGGDQILLGCGKDATDMFNSRPSDGTSHSNRARALLQGFEIGVLSK